MTIDEIAKRANVSKATVSLALNNKPGVNPQTRQKVLAIANENGYMAHRRPRGKAGAKRTVKLVAVLKPETSGIHNFDTSFFAELINSVESRCRELGYELIYTTVPQRDFAFVLQSQEEQQRSTGMILIGTYLSDEEIESARQLNPHLVVVDRESLQTAVDTVVMNNFMGGYRAAAYLVELGHRNIGCIRSSVRVSNLKERSRGFLKALKDCGVDFREENAVYINSYQRDSAETLGAMLVKMERLPSAFFCENDYNALCLLGALYNLGYRVPQDVSVIGFDNVPESSIVTPHLTTVNVDKKALGRTAVNRLHAIITGEDADVTLNQMLSVGLILRDSAARCAAPETPEQRQKRK